MGNESYGDIRTLTPEEHWAHFHKAWVALKSYTYLGKATPFMDLGVDRETMPLRHDMRNSTGGVMAAPLCIASPEPWWRDDECVPAPVTMSYAVLDPAHDVRRVEVLREVISIGRQMGFTRSRIVDADDHSRVIALSSGSGVSLGDVPPGFTPVANPVRRRAADRQGHAGVVVAALGTPSRSDQHRARSRRDRRARTGHRQHRLSGAPVDRDDGQARLSRSVRRPSHSDR
jgi:hypothetical protein